LFSTWVYRCENGPTQLNTDLERLAHKLREDERNATQRTNAGGWHYAFDVFELQDPVVAEFRKIMEQHVQAFLNHFRPVERKKKDNFRLRGWININRAGFRILPLRDAEVRAEVEGIIEAVFHDENDTVNAGEPIARLSGRDYRAELEQVKAGIAEKEAKLRMLKVGPRAEEIELARTSVTKKEEGVKYAQVYLGIEKNLYAEKLSSKRDFELAEETATLRQKELEESKGALKLLLAGSRPEEIEATEAEISRLTSQRAYLEDQLRRLNVVSPIAGIVTTHRLKDKIGATVKKGDLVAEVQELQAVTAEISVPEQEVSEVRVGQSVVLKARAHVGSTFQGKVVGISPVGSKPAEGVAQRNFVVTTRLQNADLLLKTEMSGNAKIYCGERRLYEVLFRRLVRFVRVEFWSWW
jgi:putative peptide zinc metalloprotease protein